MLKENFSNPVHQSPLRNIWTKSKISRILSRYINETLSLCYIMVIGPDRMSVRWMQERRPSSANVRGGWMQIHLGRWRWALQSNSTAQSTLWPEDLHLQQLCNFFLTSCFLFLVIYNNQDTIFNFQLLCTSNMLWCIIVDDHESGRRQSLVCYGNVTFIVWLYSFVIYRSLLGPES
jgi:hypothetical protein